MTDSIVPNPPLLQQFQALDAAELESIRALFLNPLSADVPDSITWKTASGGAVVADVVASPSQLVMQSQNVSIARTRVNAVQSPNSFTGGLLLEGAAGGGNTFVQAEAIGSGGAQVATILDDLGRSTFIQDSSVGAEQAFMGDPFSCFGVTSISYGGGTGFPIADMGASVVADPGGRHNGSGGYICRRSGYFLMMGSVLMTLHGATAATLALTTGTLSYGTEDTMNAAFDWGLSLSCIFPASAGQTLQMQLGVNANVQMLEVDSVNGVACTTFGCVQIH